MTIEPKQSYQNAVGYGWTKDGYLPRKPKIMLMPCYKCGGYHTEEIMLNCPGK